MKKPTKKQRALSDKIQSFFQPKKNYKHLRKHNGIANKVLRLAIKEEKQ